MKFGLEHVSMLLAQKYTLLHYSASTFSPNSTSLVAYYGNKLYALCLDE